MAYADGAAHAKGDDFGLMLLLTELALLEGSDAHEAADDQGWDPDQQLPEEEEDDETPRKGRNIRRREMVARRINKIDPRAGNARSCGEMGSNREVLARGEEAAGRRMSIDGDDTTPRGTPYRRGERAGRRMSFGPEEGGGSSRALPREERASRQTSFRSGDLPSARRSSITSDEGASPLPRGGGRRRSSVGVKPLEFGEADHGRSSNSEPGVRPSRRRSSVSSPSLPALQQIHGDSASPAPPSDDEGQGSRLGRVRHRSRAALGDADESESFW